MLPKAKIMLSMHIISLCKKCGSLQQIKFAKFSSSSSLWAAPTVEQTVSRSSTKRSPTPSLGASGGADDDRLRFQSSKSEQLGSFSHSQRLKFKRVVEAAEDLVDHRLNKLNNSLLWTRPSVSSLESDGTNSSFRQDEARVILSWMDKLKDSEHPLLNYTTSFTGRRSEVAESVVSGYQLRSMIVLLVANMFGFSSSLGNILEEALAKQKTLAEITELIYTSHMLHRTIVEIPKGQLPTLSKVVGSSSDDSLKGDGISMHHGNKVATLMGDLLLARTSKALSSLTNHRVTERMSDTISDFAESEAVVSTPRLLISSRNSALTVNNGQRDFSAILTYEKWLRRTELSSGSLLRNACFSATIFGGHEDEISKLASILGYKIGLVLQAYKDYSTFESDQTPRQIDLCSLPFIYQLENKPKPIRIFDAEKTYEEVRNSSYAKARTRDTLLVLTEDAIRHIPKLPASNSPSEVLKEFLVILSS